VTVSVSREALGSALRLAATGSAERGFRFANEVRGYFSSSAEGLEAQCCRTDGPDATTRAIASLAPCELTLVAEAGDDREWWAELTRVVPDHEPETIVFSLRCAGGGAIERIVSLGTGYVPMPTAFEAGSTAPARALFEGYFEALQDSRFDDAAAYFSTDALWAHPPYAGSSERELARGRRELIHTLVHKRGETPVRQVITGFWQAHDRVFLEGVIEGIPNGGSFASTGQLSASGEVNRYVAFYTAARWLSSPA
jgi:hypothetical protein